MDEPTPTMETPPAEPCGTFSFPHLHKPQSEVARQRREQIIEAAVAIIAEHGLNKLSLDRIEKRVNMKRGQLTYYFPHKEDILLAAFDRLLELSLQRVRAMHGDLDFARLTWPERMQRMFTDMIMRPGLHPDFHALEHTFLAQANYRDDFRTRLAQVYGEWRRRMAADIAASGTPPGVAPETLASLAMAVAIGLRVQLSTDEQAYDREAMLRLVVAWFAPPQPATPEVNS
jgi:AcrR family transcriptional regulator